MHSFAGHTSNTTSTPVEGERQRLQRLRLPGVRSPFTSGSRSIRSTSAWLTPRCFILSSECLVNQMSVFPKMGSSNFTSRPGGRGFALEGAGMAQIVHSTRAVRKHLAWRVDPHNLDSSLGCSTVTPTAVHFP